MISQDPTVTERRKTREAPSPHFRRVASIWGAILGFPVTPEQVLLCMAGLKIARQAGAHEPDNIRDAIGYMSLVEEVAEHTRIVSRLERATPGPQNPLPPPGVTAEAYFNVRKEDGS